MMGFCVASSNLTACTEQAGSHLRHPMHFSALSSTPPPAREFNAPTGQTSLHAGTEQPRHTIAM